MLVVLFRSGAEQARFLEKTSSFLINLKFLGKVKEPLELQFSVFRVELLTLHSCFSGLTVLLKLNKKKKAKLPLNIGVL